MSRDLLSPRWIVAHVVVLVLAAVFVRLGVWQLNRLEERRAGNQILAGHLEAAPRPLAQILGEHGAVGEEGEYLVVVAIGEFDQSEEVLVRSRTYNGEAGFHVVTPLVTAAGRAVLVDRGWVPLAMDEPPVEEALAPTGRVTVTGVLRISQEAPALGPRDPAEGRLTRVYWIDIPRLESQSPYRLDPVYIELRTQVPSQPGSLPVPAVDPDLDEGSHLSYAIQWFSFAAIALIGYAALLRRSGKRSRARRATQG